MSLVTQRISFSMLLMLYVHEHSALPATPTRFPLLPHINRPDSNLQGQNPSQDPPAPAQLQTQNLSLHDFSLNDRIQINPSLVIIIDFSYPISNTTALRQLFVQSTTFAHASIAQYGADAILPRRIVRTGQGLEYFVQPPNVRASNHFTWEFYKEVTEWLFYYLYFLRFHFACAFNVRKRFHDGTERQIGYGELGRTDWE